MLQEVGQNKVLYAGCGGCQDHGRSRAMEAALGKLLIGYDSRMFVGVLGKSIAGMFARDHGARSGFRDSMSSFRSIDHQSTSRPLLQRLPYYCGRLVSKHPYVYISVASARDIAPSALAAGGCLEVAL